MCARKQKDLIPSSPKNGKGAKSPNTPKLKVSQGAKNVLIPFAYYFLASLLTLLTSRTYLPTYLFYLLHVLTYLLTYLLIYLLTMALYI